MATKIKLIADDAITAAQLDSSASPTFTNLTLTGNLTVQGTTTTLDTTNLNVEDKNITLNYGTGDTSSGVDGAGITIQDAVNGSTDATLNWGASNDRFKLSHGLEVLTGNVGIGTTSPGTTLHLSGLTGSPPKLTLEEGGAESRIYATKNNPTNSDLRFQTEISGTIANRMIIDYNGNLLVGTTSTNGAVSGGRIFSNGRLVTTVSAQAHYFNRLSSDGEIVSFYKDSLAVGSIGAITQSGATNIVLDSNSAVYFDTNARPNTNNTYNLGSGTYGWKDLYLSGTANVGDITINGSTISRGGSGDLFLDVGGNIQLDADDNGEIRFIDGGTQYATIKKDGDAALFQSIVADGDFIIQGIDGSSFISAVRFDMSDAGSAIFNGNVTIDGFTSEKYLTLRSGFAPEDSGGVGLRAANHAASNRDGLAIYGHDGVSIFTAQTERMRIDSSGRVMIGTTHEGRAGEGADMFTIGSTGNNSGMTMRSGTSGYGSIYFSDGTSGTDEYKGYLQYGHATDVLHMAAGGSTIMNLKDGKVAIGGNFTPVNQLEIQGGGYDQIRIGSNHTDNTNKVCGIVGTTYTNQSVSAFQMFNQNGSNAIYYGSADGAHRGIQTHNFYVNTNYNSTSGHTRTLQIRSDGDVHAAYTGSADTSGYFYAGKDWGAGNHRINRAVAQGNTILVISAYGSSGQDTALFYGCSGQDASSSAAGLRMQKNSSTNRSINAAGTINASGSDYAEYVKKSDTCGTIAKGDICGIDVNSKLTDKWSEAHSFVVKSTDPSYVGGDTWGTPTRPELTKQGHADPDNPADETDSEYATRTTQHETDLAAFETALEAERVKYDRIAFSGQVPCNLTGASVGDYIIPKEGTSDAITGEAVSSPTFEQYQKAVGKVWKVLDNGNAWISVKIG